MTALGLVVVGIIAAVWGAYLIGGLGLALLLGGILVLVLGMALAWQ